MKKIHVLFLALCLVVVATSCHHGKHTTIQTSDDNNVVKVEYTGRIIFSGDNKQIVSMSPNSYLKFSKNDHTLLVERDANGRIVYEVNDSKKSIALNNDGQLLLDEAIVQINKAMGKRS